MNAGLMVQFTLMLLLFLFRWRPGRLFSSSNSNPKAYKESAFLSNISGNQGFSRILLRAKGLQFSPIARVFRTAYLELRKIYTESTSRALPESK
ncbi:MAG: hypothetical protein R2875_09205 [Desulfobacterales bacterium]